MPKARTHTVSSSARVSSGPAANSNAPTSDGTRAPLRLSSGSVAFVPSKSLSKTKVRAPQEAFLDAASPVQPRTSLNVHGLAASDISRRSSAPTVAPPKSRNVSDILPFDRQPPHFVLNPAVVRSSPFPLSGASVIASPIAQEASTQILSPPFEAEAPAQQSGPVPTSSIVWPRFPLRMEGHSSPPSPSLPELRPFERGSASGPSELVSSLPESPSSAPAASTPAQLQALAALQPGTDLVATSSGIIPTAPQFRPSGLASAAFAVVSEPVKSANLFFRDLNSLSSVPGLSLVAPASADGPSAHSPCEQLLFPTPAAESAVQPSTALNSVADAAVQQLHVQPSAPASDALPSGFPFASPAQVELTSAPPREQHTLAVSAAISRDQLPSVAPAVDTSGRPPFSAPVADDRVQPPPSALGNPITEPRHATSSSALPFASAVPFTSLTSRTAGAALQRPTASRQPSVHPSRTSAQQRSVDFSNILPGYQPPSGFFPGYPQPSQAPPAPSQQRVTDATGPASASAPTPVRHEGPGYENNMHPSFAQFQRPFIAPSASSSAPQALRPPQPPIPPPTTPPLRLGVTEEAAHLMLELHHGEVELLQPLDESVLIDWAAALSTAARDRFGAAVILQDRLARSIVELSRYLPGANGWPSVERALDCLRVKNAPSTLTPPSAPLQPPAAPATGPGTMFVRRVSTGSNQQPSLPYNSDQRLSLPLTSVNASMANSLRFRNTLRRPSNSTSTNRRESLLCSACGGSGHDAINCPHGLDVGAVVNAAQELGRECQRRHLELTSTLLHPDPASASSECNNIVREEVVQSIVELSGIDASTINSHLDANHGDPEATFVTAICHSHGGQDALMLDHICTRELHRRRRLSRVREVSRSASSAPTNEAAFHSLASQVNLPSQLGYGYRANGGDEIQLPPPPSRPLHLKRRRRSDSDLEDFIVDDHSSDPEESHDGRVEHSHESSSSSERSSSPRRARRRTSSSSSASDSDEQDHREDNSDGDSNASESDSRSGSSDEEDSESDDSSERGDKGRNGKRQSSEKDQLSSPLTDQSLSKIFKKLLDKRSRSDNNGLLASKTPSFWDLGKAPTGGYFAQTFSRVYGEFRQFKSVFGRKTGVTFKKLIMEDMIPMVRDDLKISRKEWKAIPDKELIKKLKLRLGFRERDAYIAELEACPRLPSGLKDVTVLNTKFKEMAARMLSICERARKHGVKLQRPSCKHVFSEAVKNCYRVNQWFRLHPFKSIGESVRLINSKLSDRLASAAEQRHENAMDEARLNGVRHQIGSGTTEGSSAPDRPRKGQGKGGISKNDNPRQKDKADRDKHAKKMDALYKIENDLPKGRYWHLKTPFCDGDNCTLKICQGCGKHQVVGQAWHDRPRCNCRKHPDFVETGYFHEKWPNRISIHAKPSDTQGGQTKSSSSNTNNRSAPYAARSNTVQEPGTGDKME